MKPLADRLRPNKLSEVVGQNHILSPGKPLERLSHSDYIPNMIFYGPPGVGKTTVAKLLAKQANKTLRKLNGTTASTTDIKDIISETGTFAAPNGILLYLDEIQYFNKKQQQTLLEQMENGNITLIASTTENPYFYVYNAVLSRSMVFEFKQVSVDEITKALYRAVNFLADDRNLQIKISDTQVKTIAKSATGDVRKALNTLDMCVATSSATSNEIVVSDEIVSDITYKGNFLYDKNSDEHYDTISAFQKSMRGSDPDAALHYLARLINANDLPSICRRLLVCACEDVGMACPQIIPIVKSCVDIANQVGFPEARIPLADAVVIVCQAPKSNSAYQGINAALADIQAGNIGQIPRHLQNKHYDGDDVKVKGQFYKNPHDYEGHYVKQQYLPNELVGRIYYKRNKTN